MISGGSLLKLWKNTISLRSFSGRQVFHWHVDLSPWSSQHLHLFSFFPLLLDLYQRFQILAGNWQVLHHFTGVETSVESAQILFMVEQNSSKFFTRAWLMTFFFAFFSSACSFSSYCLSPSATAHGKRGREDNLVCFLELRVVHGHLHWCHVKFHFRPGSKQWVRSAEHAGTFIYYTLISFSFWHPACSAKKNLISSHSQQ